jgi:hypothetical protein
MWQPSSSFDEAATFWINWTEQRQSHRGERIPGLPYGGADILQHHCIGQSLHDQV